VARAGGLLGGALFLAFAAAEINLAVVGPSALPPRAETPEYVPALISLHAAGDLALFLACTSVFFGVTYVLRLVNGVPSRYTFPQLQRWGGALALSLGTLMFLDFLEIWYPVHWALGWWKLGTGGIAAIFVFLLLRDRHKLAAVARALVRAEREEEASG
jgi:hypothetical protein